MKLSKTHDQPRAHIDLSKVSVGEAAKILKNWIEINKIETLNVAGSRASKAPGIHFAVCFMLNAAI